MSIEQRLLEDVRPADRRHINVLVRLLASDTIEQLPAIQLRRRRIKASSTLMSSRRVDHQLGRLALIKGIRLAHVEIEVRALLPLDGSVLLGAPFGRPLDGPDVLVLPCLL